MLQRLRRTGQVALLLLLPCVPAAVALSAAQRPTTGLKPAITDSPIRAGNSVQLGAWWSEKDAQAAWTGIKGRAGNLLISLAPTIAPVDLWGKGRYYRLRVAQPDSAEAAGVCTAMRAKRLACVTVSD